MLQSPLPLPVLPAEGRRFHAMAKPVGATCNLDCTYCYYLSKEHIAGADGQGSGKSRMSDDVLETYVRDYIAGNAGPEVEFTWQGGEPMLRDIDFYRKVVEFQQRYAQPGKQVLNDIQTNGTLINDEWCRFLKANDFWVGLSIDGPRDLHDAYRVTKGGKPTFDQVVGAFARLRRHGVPVNTLTVVNRLNAKRPLDVYRFLTRDLKSDRIQFLPCVEPRSFAVIAPQFWRPDEMPIVGTPAARPGSPGSVVTDWSVDPDEYGEFLCNIFDEWYKKDMDKVFVSLFHDLISQRAGQGAQMCIYNEFCGKALALEQDGSLYSCDHYVYPAYKLGSITTETLGELAFTPKQVSFGMAKATTLPQYCHECRHRNVCWGECPRNRFLRTPDGEVGLNYLCEGLRHFFAHTYERSEKLGSQR